MLACELARVVSLPLASSPSPQVPFLPEPFRFPPLTLSALTFRSSSTEAVRWRLCPALVPPAPPCAGVLMSALSWGPCRLCSRGRGAKGHPGMWMCSQTRAMTRKSAVSLLVTLLVTRLTMNFRKPPTPVGFSVRVHVRKNATCGASRICLGAGPTGRRGLGRPKPTKTGNFSTTSSGRLLCTPNVARRTMFWVKRSV